jgi:hypothetical protein
MRNAVLALAILSTPQICVAAPSRPDWTRLADCAAAYQANAHLADPDRAASMTATVSETADDYAKAATERYRQQAKATEGGASAAVCGRVEGRAAAFGRQPRTEVEHFIDGCPQPGD